MYTFYLASGIHRLYVRIARTTNKLDDETCRTLYAVMISCINDYVAHTCIMDRYAGLRNSIAYGRSIDIR